MFKADVNVMSWVDRNGREIPDNKMEFVIAVQVRHGSPEYRAMFEAARNREPVSISIAIDE